MASTSASELIERAVGRLYQEVPALQPLKMVVGLELRGRGDVQLYRVELPGPEVSKGAAGDARVRLSIFRADFNELAQKGTLGDWRKAFQSGRAVASGPDQILRLVANVATRQEERMRGSGPRPS